METNKNCSTCEFNFGGICAGHSDLYGYGGEITDPSKVCDEWGISLKQFIIEEGGNPENIIK